MLVLYNTCFESCVHSCKHNGWRQHMYYTACEIENVSPAYGAHTMIHFESGEVNAFFYW